MVHIMAVDRGDTFGSAPIPSLIHAHRPGPDLLPGAIQPNTSMPFAGDAGSGADIKHASGTATRESFIGLLPHFAGIATGRMVLCYLGEGGR